MAARDATERMEARERRRVREEMEEREMRAIKEEERERRAVKEERERRAVREREERERRVAREREEKEKVMRREWERRQRAADVEGARRAWREQKEWEQQQRDSPHVNIRVRQWATDANLREWQENKERQAREARLEKERQQAADEEARRAWKEQKEWERQQRDSRPAGEQLRHGATDFTGGRQDRETDFVNAERQRRRATAEFTPDHNHQDRDRQRPAGPREADPREREGRRQDPTRGRDPPDDRPTSPPPRPRMGTSAPQGGFRDDPILQDRRARRRERVPDSNLNEPAAPRRRRGAEPYDVDLLMAEALADMDLMTERVANRFGGNPDSAPYSRSAPRRARSTPMRTLASGVGGIRLRVGAGSDLVELGQ